LTLHFASLPTPYPYTTLFRSILLSNGREHYFWDYENGDARAILGFPTQADLERRANLRLHRRGDLGSSLRAVPYPTRFRFKGEEDRKSTRLTPVTIRSRMPSS